MNREGNVHANRLARTWSLKLHFILLMVTNTTTLFMDARGCFQNLICIHNTFIFLENLTHLNFLEAFYDCRFLESSRDKILMDITSSHDNHRRF